MKKWIGVILAILVIGIAGWFGYRSLKTETGSDEFVYANDFFYPYNSKGFYYFDRDAKWNFFDTKTKKFAPVCNKPNCDHKEIQSCNAYLTKNEENPLNYLLVDENNLYIVEEVEINRMDIFKADLDGSNVEKIGEIDSYILMGIGKKGNKLYINSCVTEKNPKGIICHSGGGKIDELDLETLETKLIINKEWDMNKVDVILGADENGVYYGEAFEDIRRPYWLYYYNNETEEVTQLTGENEQILRMQGDICYIKKNNEEKQLYQLNVKTGEMKEWISLADEMNGIGLLSIYDDLFWMESEGDHWYWTEGMEEPKLFPYEKELFIEGACKEGVFFTLLEDQRMHYISKEDFYKGDLEKAMCIMEEKSE